LTTIEERSAQPCPVCGEYRLAVDRLPDIAVMGVQPYSDLLGLGDRKPDTLPGIICLACGTRWRDFDAFKAGLAEPAPPAAEGTSERG
jgi:hypothetical protein